LNREQSKARPVFRKVRVQLGDNIFSVRRQDCGFDMQIAVLRFDAQNAG
jgi:hypothetical protein